MEYRSEMRRRGFLGTVGMLFGTTLTGGVSQALSANRTAEGEDVSPAEDLMREHGVLKRVLLVYGEVADRLVTGKAVDPKIVTDAARIIRDFIEDYHEKLEENHLFPRFEKARQLNDLVSVLRVQHQRGRRLTDRIIGESSRASQVTSRDVNPLVTDLRLFIRMYAPHEAREDTVLFPAFRRLVSPNEYDALGEEFEDEEHRLFGEDGFERYVDKVAAIEKSLDIFELNTFTPEVR